MKLDFARLDKHTGDSYIEPLSGKLRDEYPDVHQFADLADSQARIDAWPRGYKRHRPHGSSGTRPRGSSPHDTRNPGPPKRRCSQNDLSTNGTNRSWAEATSTSVRHSGVFDIVKSSTYSSVSSLKPLLLHPRM